MARNIDLDVQYSVTGGNENLTILEIKIKAKQYLYAKKIIRKMKCLLLINSLILFDSWQELSLREVLSLVMNEWVG